MASTLDAVEGEVAEVDVVAGGRVGGQVALAGGGHVAGGHLSRSGPEQRDPPAGQRVGALPAPGSATSRLARGSRRAFWVCSAIVLRNSSGWPAASTA